MTFIPLKSFHCTNCLNKNLSFNQAKFSSSNTLTSNIYTAKEKINYQKLDYENLIKNELANMNSAFNAEDALKTVKGKKLKRENSNNLINANSNENFKDKEISNNSETNLFNERKVIKF